ncbi:MAG: transposase [Acidobacteria bacterium]|nr:transposase [Acidobacteriota bacterium]
MPRANRYILPGYTYHLTHRCHNRKFLLRCRTDRIEYWHRLRKNVSKHRISLFDFCITSNHVHLLGICRREGDISRFMQQLEGEFADFYNNRKTRTGSFWGERFHCTMIENNEHLWNCLRYIDLNMVRAGVVTHPGSWPWCGYHELVGERKRYRLLDIGSLVVLLGLQDRESLAEFHRQHIDEAIKNQQLNREAVWTESIAVGSKEFLEGIVTKNKRRKKFYISKTEDGTSYIKEDLSKFVYR